MNLEPQPVVRAKYELVPAVLGALGACLVLFATSRFGIGATPDSVTYISVARNIGKGAGLVQYDGLPLIIFPPLYPGLLSLVSAISGRDPVSAARLVNALLFGVITFLSGLLFARYLPGSRVYAVLATVAVLVSVALVPVALSALSEPLFICFVLLFFIFLDSYLRLSALRPLLLMALSAALACMTRYVGIVLIAAGVFSILAFSRSTWRQKIAHSLVLAGLSALPLAVWALRNLSLSGTLFGPRLISGHSYYENALASWNAILSWYLPQRAMAWGPWLVLLGVIGIVAAVLASRSVRGEVAASLLSCGPFLVFALLYAGFLLISSENAFTQFIDSRYLSPIYVPLTVALLALAEALLRAPLARVSKGLPAAALTVGLAAWLIYPVTATASVVNAELDRGIGYAGRGWRDSQTVRYVRDHPSLEGDCAAYSNGVDAIYWLTGLQVKSLPARVRGPQEVADVAALRGVWPSEAKACVVQLDQIDRSAAFFTVDELMTITNLEMKMSFADGAIYVLSRK